MKRAFLFAICLFSAVNVIPSAQADDHVINDQRGNEFMEEVAPPAKALPPGKKSVARIIESPSGRSVLQEITTDTDPLTRPYRQADDYSNVGVPTDKAGNIVPLNQRNGSPVMQLGGTGMQAYNEYAPVPLTTNVPGQLVPSYTIPAYPMPMGYPVGYGQPSALNFRVGGLNIGVGNAFPGYGGPIGMPYPIAAPLGAGTMLGGTGGILPGPNMGLPSAGSYTNNTILGPSVIQSSGSWRSF